MKSLIVLFFVSIFLVNCSHVIFKITSEDDIDIYLDDEYKGKLEKNKKMSLKKRFPYTTKVVKLEGKNDQFQGFIKVNYVDGVLDKNNAAFKHKRTSSIFKSTDNYSIKFTPIFKSHGDEVTKIIEKKYGYLKLTSNVEDVDIYVDDVLIGQIKKGPLNKKIESGRHNLMARKRFFMPIMFKLDLKDKEVFPYHFELVKASGWKEAQPGESRIIQARGNLTIVTERSDYVLSLEGEEKIPPFELKDIPAGMYIITVKRPGFEKDITITVDDSELTFIDLDEMFGK